MQQTVKRIVGAFEKTPRWVYKDQMTGKKITASSFVGGLDEAAYGLYY